MKNNQDTKRVFSFGAGVQSTAIFALILHEPQRLIDVMGGLPDVILFADTGGEGKEALENFERCKKLSPVPMYRVKNHKRNAETNPLDIPFFAGAGLSARHCTRDWKIAPIKKAIRKLFKPTHKKPLDLWLGISVDEAQRMKESWVKYLVNRYPLIELGLDRQDCYSILKQYNLPAVKSACYFCPFQIKRWKENKEIDKAIAYEKKMQKASEGVLRETPYLHPSRQPLEKAYADMVAQQELFTFQDECEGYCGV